jgi:Holliday junction resolvasome RuvABC DNA-binding subunit
MFGSEGKSVAPLVIGSLMGLQGVGHTEGRPPGEQVWDEESVIGTLEAMAYKKAEARSMFLRASPRLRGDETLEEVIRIILRESAKEG